MRGTWFVLVALAVGCGHHRVGRGSFEIVGRSDRGARGLSGDL